MNKCFDTSEPVYTGTATKCTFSGPRAIPDTAYEFRVSAACDGKASYWTRLSASTLPVPQPSALHIGEISSVGALLAWDPVCVPGRKKSVTYEVERTSKCTEKEVIEVGNSSNNDEDNDNNDRGNEDSGEKMMKEEKVSYSVCGDLRPDTEYTLRVRAFCCGKVSEWSEPLSAKTEPLPPVSGLGAKEVSTVGVSVAWDMLSLPGNAAQHLTYQAEYRKADSEGGEGGEGEEGKESSSSFTAVYDGAETTAVVGSLEPETKYEVRVRPVCYGQPGVWTSTTAATTKIPQPASFAVKESGPVSLTVSWEDPAGVVLERGSVVYNVSYCPLEYTGDDENCMNKNIAVTEEAYNEETKSYALTIDNLEFDMQYNIAVWAVWATGAKSMGEKAWTKGKTLPVPAPKNLRTENATFTSVGIAWDPVMFPEKSMNYAVERFVGTVDMVQKTPEGEDRVCKVDKYEPVSESLEDSTVYAKKLVPDTEHTFRVRAVYYFKYIYDKSKVSEWVSVTGRTAVVPPVTKLEASGISPFSAKLSWKEEDEEEGGGGEEGKEKGDEEGITYQVERVVEGEGSEGEEKTVTVYEGAEFESVVAPLAPETEYAFRVRRVCRGKTSEWTRASTTTLRLSKIATVTAGETTPLTAVFKCEVGDAETMQYAEHVRIEAQVADKCNNEDASVGSLHEMGKDVLIAGLVPDTEYTYCFRLSYDGKKFSDWSDGVAVKTLVVPAPVDFAATAEGATPISVELTWGSAGAAYAYQVESPEVGKVYEGKECRAVACGLTPETDYTFNVRAVFNAEKVSEWVPANAKTLPVPAPADFAAAQITPLSATFTWKEVVLGEPQKPAAAESTEGENTEGENTEGEKAEEEKVRYKICYAEDNENVPAEEDKDKTLYEGDGEPRFELCGLMPETEYKVRICAMYKGKTSEWAAASATTAVVPVPEGFAVAEAKALSLHLTWAKIALAEGVVYKVERVSDDASEVVYEGEECTYEFSGLAPETAYSLRLCAVYKDAKASAWAPLNAKTAPVPVPEGFTVAEAKPLSLALTWNRVTLGAGEAEDAEVVYKVEHVTKVNSEAGEKETERTEEVYSGADNAFVFNGLMPDTACNLRLCAVYKASTNRAWAKLNAKTAPVPVPEGFVVTEAKPLSLALTWNTVTLEDAVEDAEIAYKVERVREEKVNAPDGTTKVKEVAETVYEGKECAHEFCGLMPDTVYSLRVCAIHRNAKTSAWGKLNATTAAVPLPEGLTVAAAPTPVSVSLKWALPAGLTGENIENNVAYEVEQRTKKIVPAAAPPAAEGEAKEEEEEESNNNNNNNNNNNEEEEMPFAQLYKGEACECCARDLVPETEYEYRMRAVYKGAKASAWATVSATTAEVPPPTEVAAGDIEATSLVLTWAKVTGEAASSVTYEAQQRAKTLENSENEDGYIAIPIAAAREEGSSSSSEPGRASLEDLVPGTEYDLRVRSVCRGKASTWTTIVAKTAGVPQVEGLVAAEITPFVLTLQWTPLTMRGASETRYQVMQFENATGVVATAEHTLRIEELVPEAEYEYRVRAVRCGKPGPWSAPVKATMARIPPVRGLRTTKIGADNIGLAWDVPAEFSREHKPWYEVTLDDSEDPAYGGEDPYVRLFGLESLHDYTFRARVVYDDGIASDWAALEASTLPQNFDAVEATPVSVRLRWSAIPGAAPSEVTYEIVRDAMEGENNGGEGVTVFTGPAPTPSEFVAEGLVPDTEYTFRIHAFYSGKTSVWVPTGAKTLPVPAPAACDIVNLGPFTFTLAWQEVPFVTGSEAAHYLLVHRRPRTTTTTAAAAVNEGEENEDEEVVVYDGRDLRAEFSAATGIVPETRYRYVLYAVHGEKRSAGVTVEVTTPKVPAPGELTADNIAQTSARLAWRPATIAAGALPEGAACVYDLQQRLIVNGVGNFGDVGEAVGEYAAEGLAVGSDYEFRVRTRCMCSGRASYCSEWTVAGFRTLPLPAPEDFRVEVIRSTSAYLSWSPVSVPGVPDTEIAYDVYRKKSSDADAGYTLSIGGVEQAGDLVEVSGLEAETGYIFRVCATTVVISGQKKASDYSSLNLKTAIMHPMTFKTTSITPTTMALAWTPGGALPTAEKPTYRVEIRACEERGDADGSEEKKEEKEKEKETLRERLRREEIGYRVLCSGVAALKYTAEGLDPDTTYALRLRAEGGEDGDVVSDWASLEAATTPIPAPKKLRISSVTPVSAALSWAPIPGVPADLIEYIVERRVVKTTEVYHDVIDEADEPEIVIPEMPPPPSDNNGNESDSSGNSEEMLKRLQERVKHEAEMRARIEAAKKAKRAAEERARLRAENKARKEALEQAMNFAEVYCGPLPPAEAGGVVVFEDLVPETEYEVRVCAVSTRNRKAGEWAAVPMKSLPVPAPQKFKGDDITTTTVTLNWATSDTLPDDVVVYQIEKKLKYAPPEPSEDDYHAPKQSLFWYLFSFLGIGSGAATVPGSASGKKVPCNDPFERIFDGTKIHHHHDNQGGSTSVSPAMSTSSSPAPPPMEGGDYNNNDDDDGDNDNESNDESGTKLTGAEIERGEDGLTRYIAYGLDKEAIYDFRVRAACRNRYSEWVDTVVEMPKKKFADCTWKRCPRYVDEWGKYIVTGINSRIVTKTGADCSCWRTTVLGDVPLVGGATINKWSIKVLQSKSDGNSILIGVAPITINQNSGTWSTGWYLDCFSSTLYSGAPQFYHDRQYGPRKSWGKYVLTGDIVDVEMDMKNRKLSFSLGGVEIGVAYDSIPIDIPLVPAVLLGYENDSIELLNPSFFSC